MSQSDANINGLQLRLRVDRVDQVDGGRLILDYKTGKVDSQAWSGDRPDEPQVPLYCVTNERPVAGAAIASIHTGKPQFRGLTAEGVTLPELSKMKMIPALPFDAQLREWRRVMERLAGDFRSGVAHVDPKPDACDNCGLRALCRIRELENDRG